jgi:ribonucleoside-diphosphate reductase beta chain
VLAEYRHFVNVARRVQWDADAIDLTADADGWPGLEVGIRGRLLTLLAGFGVGETQVAAELRPFPAQAQDPAMRACFEAQRRDEQRHARFFDRVAAEVLAIPGDGPQARQRVLAETLQPAYLDLFDRRLPAVARELALGDTSLPEAVGLYHMVLEGVVFSAGLRALLALLAGDPPLLPGVRRGVELVLRDERWHVGFGTRTMLDAGLKGDAATRMLVEGEGAAHAWGSVADDALVRSTIAIHHRRLAAVGIGAVDAARPSTPPRRPFRRAVGCARR